MQAPPATYANVDPQSDEQQQRSLRTPCELLGLTPVWPEIGAVQFMLAAMKQRQPAAGSGRGQVNSCGRMHGARKSPRRLFICAHDWRISALRDPIRRPFIVIIIISGGGGGGAATLTLVRKDDESDKR